MPAKNYITGFYNVAGQYDEVTVPSTGRGPADYAALSAAMRKRHPRVSPSGFVRTGSIIERRGADDTPRIDLESGKTLRQLFDNVDGTPRSSLRVGQVFFSGTPCYVMLTYSRASSFVGVMLLPRLKTTDTPIVFSNQITPQAAVSALPGILRDVLGRNGTALELHTRKVVSK